jgi:glycosyltransferase involved in cell wall biosynthesis
MPLFSIVIATRDRAGLFERALDSVAWQDFEDTEIVVVNDGSKPDSLPVYAAILARAQQRLGSRLRSFQLVRRAQGHGSSYSLNYGVEQARGDYVCFLDDDDLWTDSAHLSRVAQVVLHQRQAGRVLDVYMANQAAFRAGQRIAGSVWIEALEGQLRARGRMPDADGAYAVDIADLLGSGGFCHLNTLTVRRDFFLQVGGLDEGIRWENDRDLFLRLLDNAEVMIHHPACTARHHVPDPQVGSSITTGLGQIERRLWQLRVMDKCTLGLHDPRLRAYGRLHKVYALKRIAEELAQQKAWRTATFYALEALAARPTLKWVLFTAYCGLRRLGQRNAR